MSTAIATATPDGAIMERVIAAGDLSKLTPAERLLYYKAVCESVGLNPLTQPFSYITLNNKLTLYARKDCTDQLRQIHNVSIISLEESERDGVFCVTAKAQNGAGRIDMAKGAVSLNALKGEALANAMMKAETKAKRRVTLSICGLGFLDETEAEGIPAARMDITPEMTPAQVLAASFARYDVTEQMLTAYLGHPLTAVSDEEMSALRGLYVKVANGEEWQSLMGRPVKNEAEPVSDVPPNGSRTATGIMDDKRSEILSLGAQLTALGVAIQVVEDIIDAKAGVRRVEDIESIFDANAVLTAMETRLEIERKVAARAAKKK